MFKKRFSWMGLLFACMLTAMGILGAIAFALNAVLPSINSTVRMTRTLELIERHYVGDVDKKTLCTGAVRGMVKALDDPYSVYLDEDDYAGLSTMAEGHFGGVGMIMGVENKNLVVVAPIEDTPAYRAGIKSGDHILAVDGKKTAGQDLETVVKQIRGKDGTAVELLIQTGKEAPRTVNIVRSDIKIKSVYGEMHSDKIGYIRISSFSSSTGSDFAQKYKELEAEGMKALVLDLRGNPGGLLTAGVDVAKLLVPKGPIVSVTEKDGDTMTEYSRLDKVKYPLAVLVDKGSASASEIVAGAVQDTEAGKLFGVKTYGKGSVQTVYNLGADTGIKLTMAKYYTPKGRSINGIGIEPDVVVEAKDDKGTNQLATAEAYLKEVLAAKE